MSSSKCVASASAWPVLPFVEFVWIYDFYLFLEYDQHVAHVHAVALGDEDLRDGAAALGDHVVFHLHGFEDADGVARSNIVTGCDFRPRG